MKKLTALLLALALLLSLPLCACADSKCTHRWVEPIDEDPAYCIYCGALDYDRMNSAFPSGSFNIQVLQTMNCRKQPELSAQISAIAHAGVYTITEARNGWWGKLISGAGWISLCNPEYISIVSRPGSGNTGSTGSGYAPSGLSALKNARVGDVVTFGHYEQDNRLSNGSEPICWIVLEKTAAKVLLISQDCLECRPYNDSYQSVTWESCSLRRWLNDTFFYEAFSSNERDHISFVSLRNDSNSTYGTDGGKSTYDRVFLLSYDEAAAYFASDGARTAKSSDYAKDNGVYVCGHGDSWWWLRGPGEFARYAALVGTEGNVNNGGNYVDRVTGAVRPAVWVNIN